MLKPSLGFQKHSVLFFVFFFLSHILHLHTRSHSCRGPQSRKGHVWTLDTSEKPSAFSSKLFPDHQCFYLSSLLFRTLIIAKFLHVMIHVMMWYFLCLIRFSLFPQVVLPAVVHQQPLPPAPESPSSPELWSVTMVFVSFLSNAIITLNSYSVKRTSAPQAFPVSGDGPPFRARPL